ncbi:MlaD family protein [Gordonia sp. NPDC003422]
MIGPPVDHSGRGLSTGRHAVWGLAMVAIVAIVTIPIALYAQRAFDDDVEITLTSAKVADSLTAGADVKYRGLLVGRVDDVEVTDDGQQRMTVALDADQARGIDGQLTARFVPSNIFGVVGVELTPVAPGPAVRAGDVVAVDADSAGVSAIAVLRDIGSVTTTLTGNDVNAMINRLDQVVDQLSPLISGGFELFVLAKQHQRMPFADVLRISADTLHGADRLAEPFVDLFTTLVEKTEMYADPVQTAKVTGALTGLVQTFITLGQVVGHNPRELATVLDASLTLGAPLGYTLSTVPASAADIHELIGRLERAFPKDSGAVRLRVGATLASLPQITSVLAGMGGTR